MEFFDNYSKLVDTVLKNLNWNLITDFYESDDSLVIDSKGIKMKPKTKDQIKKELKDLIKFVIESGSRELHHEQWIIFWRNGNEDPTGKLGHRLEIAFSPTRAISSSDNSEESQEETPDIDDLERNTLKEMLENALKEENFELCSVIHNRLKKLSKKKNK